MRVDFEKISRPLDAPVATSRGIFTRRESLLVKISQPRDGVSAAGECAPWLGFGCETLARAERFLEKISGRDLPALPPVPDDLPCLAHALSAAAFFLKNPDAKNAPEPPPSARAKLLRRDVPETPPEKILALAARERELHGFSVFKIKIGLRDADDEIRFCEKLLADAPAGMRFRFDANGAFSKKILPALVALSAAPALEFFEQPLPPAPENDAEIFSCAEKFGAKFALDESVRAPDAFPTATPVVAVVKPALAGDFQKLLAWLARADAAPVVVSTVFENSAAGRAALFLACSRVAKNRRRAFGLG